MAVNLSPYGGVGAQFLDNSGNVLTGGKIYTYAAGTTTNQATYTSSLGNTPLPNPIILNAAGRVPTGEIWLTDGLVYKFVLTDSNDVLIATYDNITGINSNFVAFTNEQEIQTATAGQTVFNLTTITYQTGTNSLSVFVDGVNQYGPGAQYAYLETDSDTVTFTNGLHVGAEVKFTTSALTTSNATNASVVAYDPPFTGAVGTNVEDKLAQTVSVKDFGAVGDGVTDDTVAIQAAIDASVGQSLDFLNLDYAITSTIYLRTNSKIKNGSLTMTDTTYKGSIIETDTFATAGQNTNVSVLDFTFNGTCYSQPVGVANFVANEGTGFGCSIYGGELINVYVNKAPGVGFIFKNAGILQMNIQSSRCGQEGIIFDNVLDIVVDDMESYLDWDSDRDFDYTKTKVSLYRVGAPCAGILCLRGSAEIQHMHPNNNRFGWAFATYSTPSTSSRIRVAHGIAEGSAGQIYIDVRDRFQAALLNLYNTRGKYGFPMFQSDNTAGLNISEMYIEVSKVSEYPTNGTYRAVEINGARNVIDNLDVRVGLGGALAPFDCAVYIEGSNHSISGNLNGALTVEGGGASTGVQFGFPTTNCKINLNTNTFATGLVGASGTTDPGVCNLTFLGCTTDISATYLGFLTNGFLAKSYIYNFNTGKTTRDQQFGSGTLAAATADGTVKTVTINYSTFYKQPNVKSLMVANRGSASYNADGINLWLAGITTTQIIVKYKITSYTGDFELLVLAGY